MANNVLNNTETEVLSNLVLDEFTKKLAPLSAFTLDASPAPMYRGDKVKVLSVATGSEAVPFSKATGYEMQGAGASTIDVTLEHYYTSAELSDTDWRNSGLLSMDVFARSKGHGLGQTITENVMAFFALTSSHCPTSMSLDSASFNVDAVTEISRRMDEMHMPTFGRTLILNPEYHQVLRKDDSIKNAVAYGGTEVIRRGEIASVDSFERVIKTDCLPESGSAPIEHVGFALVPQAGVVAMRGVATQDNTMYRQINTYSDDETGIAVTNKTWGNPDMGALRSVWECNAGWESANPMGIIALYRKV